MQLCWAGCPGGFRGTAFYARFTRLIVSRTRGAYASPRHLGERNCTSTAPKLSKTSAVSTPHPWHMCHFEGTDRSFALQVSALALLGREAEARAALAVLQELQPDVTITRNKEDRGYRIATPAFHRLIERYLDGLRKAGLPE